MANMSLNRNPMPSQAPDIRNKNFDEVALGYTEEIALDEATRCLNCKNMPCVSGCPVNVRIPEFIEKICQKDYEGAYGVISLSSSLPAICGRVCPQENQCESKCTRGLKGEPVAIGRLERFVADRHMQLLENNSDGSDSFDVNVTEFDKKENTSDANASVANASVSKASVDNASVNNNDSICKAANLNVSASISNETAPQKVAIVGSGPSGLACAGDLAKAGYSVTVFEALHTPGGVLVYGIPEFRLPKSIVAKEIEGLKKLGVKFETNMVVGKVISVDELFELGYKAVFIGTGAGLPRFMNIPGENCKGVYSANEFLTRINLMKAYRDVNDTPVMRAKRVAVVGGGNVAMDAARCALRMGAEEVYIIYRRSLEELPARREEVEHAKEEGIIFKLLNNPVRILSDDKMNVTGIECVQMELGEPDASGRRSPVEKENSNFVIDVDAVIMAIGTSPNPLIRKTTEGIEFNIKGGIVVNEDGLTTRDNVFAGGDAVTGAATVILAMGAGKKAAAAIDKALREV